MSFGRARDTITRYLRRIEGHSVLVLDRIFQTVDNQNSFYIYRLLNRRLNNNVSRNRRNKGGKK